MKLSKLIRITLAVVAAAVTPCWLPATDDLAAKRSWLIYYMRSLGPLAPADWPDSGALYSYNYPGSTMGSLAYHPQGTFGYAGEAGSEYFFRYLGPGLNLPSPSKLSNSGTYFDHYGLREYSAQPWPQNYYFYMDPSSYNVAGLKYTRLHVFRGLGGYSINPNQGFHTAWLFSPATTLELAQEVETPSFKVTGYWFGHYPHFPQDHKLPAQWGQDTVSQGGGGFLVRNIHQTSTNLVWVQEGVYRPGFALQPGHGAPRLHTYMQQYFSAAYRCDPGTGAVPRTGTPNWDGRGRINAAVAQPAGALTGDGYFFKPNEFGKAILTTRPQEDGSYGEAPVYTIGLMVDQNRDGAIDTNDVTTAQNPHRFWVNNDCDRHVFEERNLWDELDVDPAANVTDAAFVVANRYIPSLRDLEDYDRLHIRGLRELCRDLPPGHTVTLRWKSVLSGNPGIFLFEALEADGGRAYLTDETTASNQVQTAAITINGTTTHLSLYAIGQATPAAPLALHDGAARRGTNDFFLYCGTGRGAGELAVEVHQGSRLLGSVSVFLDLRDVKEMYERWTVGEPPGWRGSEPAANPSLFDGGLPPGVSATAFLGDENSGLPYILFVHGWNMPPWEKDTFAETAFKRLYWQGYQGRFGAFRWPTAYGFTGSPWDVATDSQNFDKSEFIAWNSAEALRKLLVSLNHRYPVKVYLLAHSMGNVTAGEALALQAEQHGGNPIVNTYVASQAAVPLHCYNPASEPVFSLPFDYVHPKLPNLGRNWDSGTANVYPGWLEANRNSSVRRVNFYNRRDFALSQEIWGFNQLLKPDKGYVYIRHRSAKPPGPGAQAAAAPQHLIPSPARRGLAPPLFRTMPGIFGINEQSGEFPGFRLLDWEYNLQDMYEVMAFASEARTMALGAAFGNGVLDARVSLWDVWPPDNNPGDDGTYSRHKWHSAQFRSNNMNQATYWQTLLGPDGFRVFFQ